MSKILLIKPRLLGLENHVITPPMGLMYIGAMLKKAGHETKIHDCALDYKDFHALRFVLKEWRPNFIGVSMIISEVEQTRKIMTLIRKNLPEIPVTFGGPWPSANPEESIKRFGADFVVLGEGEKAFPELIAAVNSGSPVISVPGTAYTVNNNVIINPGEYLTEEELNLLPFPAWELLDQKIYAKMYSLAALGSRPYMSIVTSRGCPFGCVYCHNTMGKVFRRRSAESVLAEIKELRFQHGFKEFEIIDDCFNFDYKRMYAILTGIRDTLKDIKLHFPSGLRADLLGPQDMKLFKEAGTISVSFGIETSSPRLQKLIHKNLDIDKAIRTINASVKLGIYSTGFFIIGFPTETYKEASETIAFAASSTLNRALFMPATPLAGTKLAEMASDVIKKNQYINSPDNSDFSSNMNISAMSGSEFRKAFRQAYKKFYMNPKRIYRLFILHPDPISLVYYAFKVLSKVLPWKTIS